MTIHSCRDHRRDRSARLVVLSLAAVFGGQLAYAVPVAGQPNKMAEVRKREQAAAPLLEEAANLLIASDRTQVREGIEMVGLANTDGAARMLAQRIRQGLPLDLLELAVETLRVIASPAGEDVLRDLANHRRPIIRRKALEALGAMGTPHATPTLVRGLSDMHPGVRAGAAKALGEARDAAAKDPLFLALERGVVEASGALGHIVESSDLPRLTQYLGQLSFYHIAPALRVALERREVSLDSKLRVITRLGELATPEAKGFLQELAAAFPDRTHPLRRAADAAALPIQN